MNRFIFAFCGLIIIFSSVQAESLLEDPLLEIGYNVMSPQKDIYTDRAEIVATHYILTGTPTPEREVPWRLVQWGSDKSLANSLPVVWGEKGLEWSAVDTASPSLLYKKISIDPGKQWRLELNGLAEFSSDFFRGAEKNTRYLSGLNQYWPHLLLVQNIQSKKLDQYNSLMFSLDAKLLFDYKNLTKGYKPEIHAARFPIAFSVRNTLSGNMFWLTLVVYDDRYIQSGLICKKCLPDKAGKEHCHIAQALDEPGRWECPFDGTRWNAQAEKQGTQKMIFRVPTVAFTQENIHNGDWVAYQINLLPFIKAAIAAAAETGHMGKFPRDLRFYKLDFFSMGWEITGLNHAAMAIKNLSLTGH